MTPDTNLPPPPHRADERPLDPGNWGTMRALGERIVGDAMDYLETVRDRPAWVSPPVPVRAKLAAPLPREGIGAPAAYAAFRESILPYTYGNIHPRFWGWVNGTGTPFTVLADLLASTMNPNVYGSDSGPFYVEHQVLAWLKTLLGYPSTASGALVSGGSVANLTGLAAALHAKAPIDLAERGVGALPRPMTLYASTETHFSVEKAVRLLGLGNANMRRIPVKADFTIDTDALRAAVAADRANGFMPFCVVGNAGTVATAAFDPIDALAEYCEAEGLWLHVDGAFGALAAASPHLRQLTHGMDRADSVAFDLHKWLYMPIDAGCVLVREPAAHRRPFTNAASYVAPMEGGLGSIADPFGHYSIELTRGFRALKVWLGFTEQGADRYVRAIEQDVSLARYLAHRIATEPELELLAPVSLNVVCFRYRPAHVAPAACNALNRDLLIAVQESGVAVPSQVIIQGQAGLRVALTNHRTLSSDLDLLLETVLALGRKQAALPGRSPLMTGEAR